MNLSERLNNALAALTGKLTPEPEPLPAPPPEPGTAAARIVELEMQLTERNDRIAALLAESNAQRGAARGDAEAVAADRMSKLLRRLAPLLAQADAMRHFEAAGKPLRAEDAFALVSKIEKVLAEEGVERIGEAGEETGFDPRFHQRLSGGDVKDGDRVHVRFVGFRQGDRVLNKALVTRKETDGNRD